MTYLKIRQYSNDKPIIFGLNRMASPFSVNMTGNDVQPDADGKKYVPEGMFVVSVGNKIRFLPRTKVRTAVATNTAQVTLASPSFQFLVGDVLYAQATTARLAFEGTFTAGDVYVVKIGDVNYSVTAPASPTASSVVQAWLTTNAAALTTAGITSTQLGATGTIQLVATDSHKVDAQSSSGSVSIRVASTDPGYLGDNLLPLGTIQSIALPNQAGDRVVTLAANATYALPANSIVGVRVEKYLGIYPLHLDYTEEPVVHLAPITECDGVYEQNLPYCDSHIKREFEKLNINKRFYRNI